MRKILIVDDEQKVIDEFKKKISPIQDALDIEFSTSGDEALDLLSKATYDAIIADMYMPKMDGAELLTKAKDNYPEIVRIVLSEQSDKEMVMRFAKSAQQFLLKSCSLENTIYTIERACKLRDLQHDKRVKMLVSGISDLPSLPTLYNLILKEMESPNASLKKVGDIISQDLSMAAKILQVVNSSQFGFVKQIADPQQAAVYLGMNTLKSLILSSNLFSSFPGDENYGGSTRDELWIHSLMVARLAKNIASTIVSDRILLEEVYTAGLLHDVGKLIFSKIPKKYEQVEAFMETNGCGRLDAEYEVLKTSHAELGAYLLGRWDLSSDTVETTAFHHNPSSLIKDILTALSQSSPKSTTTPSLTESLTGLTILTSVHVANALMIQEELTPNTSSLTHIDMLYLKTLGLTDKLEEWIQLGLQARGIK